MQSIVCITSLFEMRRQAFFLFVFYPFFQEKPLCGRCHGRRVLQSGFFGLRKEGFFDFCKAVFSVCRLTFRFPRAIMKRLGGVIDAFCVICRHADGLSVRHILIDETHAQFCHCAYGLFFCCVWTVCHTLFFCPFANDVTSEEVLWKPYGCTFALAGGSFSS